jgi:hypothetical protein
MAKYRLVVKFEITTPDDILARESALLILKNIDENGITHHLKNTGVSYQLQELVTDQVPRGVKFKVQ